MPIKLSCIFRLVIIAFFLASSVDAFCPPGCECDDQTLAIACDYAQMTSIPILLNPMLKTMKIRNSNGLKMDTFSIALYQELESLELSNCQISQIPLGFFSQLGKLKRLNLRGNKLSRIDHKMFAKITTLEFLDLSANQIDRLSSSSPFSLPNLLSLNLSSNLLHILPPQLGLHKLQLLNLARNRFAKLPSAEFFNGTSQLEELSLAGNILSELPSNVFRPLKTLKRLNLASNLISYVEADAFNGMDALRELNLAQNLLSTPKGNWAKLPTGLERLDLSANSWTEVPSNAFDGAELLKELFLEDMSQLREVKALAFASLPSIERISLGNSNLLSKIHPNAFGGRSPKLRHLDLSNGQLSTLAPEMLSSDWSRLKTLKLDGNRWNCDCALMSFLPTILEDLERAGQFVDNVACEEPEEDQGKSILAVAKEPAGEECATAISASAIFFQQNLLWIVLSAATILLLTSLILLIFCIFVGGKGKKRAQFCCGRWAKDAAKRGGGHNNAPGGGGLPSPRGGLQLYSATGSSYTESLIYEKGGGQSTSSTSANPSEHSAGGTNRCNNHSALFNPALAISRLSPSTSDASNGLTNPLGSVDVGRHQWGKGDTATKYLYSPSNGDGDAGEYYSSINDDHSPLYAKDHRSGPPDSPPPPPPPIFSDPPNWPPPNLLLASIPCQMAAPPYHLRGTNAGNCCNPSPSYQQQQQYCAMREDRSRPPSIYAPQPPIRRKHPN